MIVTEWVGHDGRSGLRFDGEGKKTLAYGHGIGNNYWDLLPFGYKDTYATIQYYDALLRMASYRGCRYQASRMEHAPETRCISKGLVRPGPSLTRGFQAAADLRALAAGRKRLGTRFFGMRRRGVFMRGWIGMGRRMIMDSRS